MENSGENNVKQRVKNVLSYKNIKYWGIALGIVVLAAAGIVLFTVRHGMRESMSDAEVQGIAEDGENAIGVDSSNESIENEESKEKAENAGLRDDEHDTLSKALEVWATAFTDRDGQKLYELAADKEEFMAWDMVNEPESGVITFGLSSPWPWEYGYNIRQNDDNSATIRYYMNTSAPEIYIADEDVYTIMKDGLYYIGHNELTEYYSIDSKEEFTELYGKYEYDFGYENTGYTSEFYILLMQHLINGTNPEYYEQYTEPVSAAVNLLHLGKGEGSAKLDMIPMRVEGMDIPWLEALSFAGEGSRALVTYTFAEDDSTIEIVMELIEGSQGIWVPLTDDSRVREVYQTRELDSSESGGEDAVYIQTSSYGIYRLDKTGLTCLYPAYIPTDMVWTVADGRMYFPYSASYQLGDLDYAEDTIFILDVKTEKIDKETYALTDNMRKLLPLRWISVYGGFINLFGGDGEEYSMPLINTGVTALSSGNVWQGKGVSQLGEQEKNAYGVAMREHILEKPETLVNLSNRTFIENFAYIDMDGDGKTERISLSADSDDGSISSSYDSYVLKVGDSHIKGWAEELHNDIWALSLDGEQILLALYEDGPSADPLTTLFAYANGSVRQIGAFGDDIRHCEIENGIIKGTERHDVLQTDWIKAEWGIDSKGRLERVSHETYDFTALNTIILSKPLPVYTEPDEGSESRILKSQTVKFLKTDNTFSWIYAEGGDGDSGWFEVDGLEIKGLGLDYYEVFEDLNFAD